MTTLPTFRVHFDDDDALDIPAKDAAAARAVAKKRRPGVPIRKVKVLKEQADA